MSYLFLILSTWTAPWNIWSRKFSR